MLEQFKDVNDPYISERLYAVAYGVGLRSRSDHTGLRKISEWVYENLFKNGAPPENILLRDYSRGIIEIALTEGIKLRISKKKITPPFKSHWPKRVPSEKFLRNKYYPENLIKGQSTDRKYLDIWGSVMYNFGSLADFGNYILDSAVNNWSGRRLNGKEINRRILFDNFKKKLTKEQQKLLGRATNPFFGIKPLTIFKSMKVSSYSEPIDEAEIKRQDRELKKMMKNNLTYFCDSLSSGNKAFFEKEIEPFLDDRGAIRDSLERFNTGLAQRWVFNRVVQLGWDQKLHGQFDSSINRDSVDRSANKAERIGKKYQWIAMFELLAKVADNFEFKRDSWSNDNSEYTGSWQLSLRDIDPSCVLKDSPRIKPEGLPVFSDYRKRILYDLSNKGVSSQIWLEESRYLPDPKKIIQLKDDDGHYWLSLEGTVEWQEETSPEQEQYSLPTKRLWYMTKSYFVKKQNRDRVFEWAKHQRFMNRWMPESHQFNDVYLSEYPWAPAFLHQYIPYYHHDGWTRGRDDATIPAKVLVTTDEYSSSGSSRDCSTNDSIGIKLPAKYLVDNMGLSQRYSDGRFFNKEGVLVAYDPQVFDIDMPKQLLIRNDQLQEFLRKKGLDIVWTLLGEKNIMSSRGVGQPLGWLEINGAYALVSDQLRGVIKSKFKKSA